jgi:hypothetical protein
MKGHAWLLSIKTNTNRFVLKVIKETDLHKKTLNDKIFPNGQHMMQYCCSFSYGLAVI